MKFAYHEVKIILIYLNNNNNDLREELYAQNRLLKLKLCL